MADENKSQAYIELGSSGLSRSGGYIQEEFLPELSGSRAIKIYREMADNDAIVGAVLFAIQMLIKQVKWDVKTKGETPEDLAARDFVWECFNDMSTGLDDVISEILSMMKFGYCPLETVYKIRGGDTEDPIRKSKFSDGKIGWRKMPIRAQETVQEWVFAEDGGLKGLIQLAPPLYHSVFIPIEKLLLFRTTMHKNNPEGRSMLRNAYRSWYFKSKIENIEGIGIERDLAGIPVMSVPAEIMGSKASAQDKTLLNECKKIVTSIRRDEQEGLVLPSAYDEKNNKLYDLKLLTTGGTRQFDTDKIINRYDQRIAMTVLADFILVGHQKAGSFALNSSKTDLFVTAIGAWLASISSVFNTHAIPKLLKMNAMKVTKMPELCHGDIENVDLVELGDYITKLSGAGVPLFPNPALEKYLLGQANIPEEVLEESVKPGWGGNDPASGQSWKPAPISADPEEEEELEDPGTAPDVSGLEDLISQLSNGDELVEKGGPGSGCQGPNCGRKPGKMSSISDKGQIKISKPKTVADATTLLREVGSLHSEAQAAAQKNPTDVNLQLRARHATLQLSRAIGYARELTGKK